MTPRARQISYIIEQTAREFGCTKAELVAKGNRGQIIDEVRRIAMHLSREISGLTLPALAKVFKRDHSTLSVGMKSIRRHMQEFPKSWTTRRVVQLEARLREEIGASMAFPHLNGAKPDLPPVQPAGDTAVSVPLSGGNSASI